VRSDEQLSLIAHGGYILKHCDGTPDAIIIATGSEVALAMEAAAELEKEGKKIRVVSMPCTEVFDLQDHEYRESVLPSDVTARVVVEAGVTDYWWKYAGHNGRVIGIDRFGESAPANVLFPHFGFTVDHVVSAVKGVM